MATYEYRCAREHITELVRPRDDREAPATCERCGSVALVIFSPNAAGIRIPSNFRSVNGCPTWSDFYDRTEKEMAKDPSVEKYAVAASRSHDTVSQPGPELKRKVSSSRDKYPSAAV